eukprot:GHVT01065282.1.p1 GENE.GHVT01065282.1~~GHVT01065282.1.p1  ORF type:complete len:132 (-),score=2.24 GHVT01065282.1:319-714(-)
MMKHFPIPYGFGIFCRTYKRPNEYVVAGFNALCRLTRNRRHTQRLTLVNETGPGNVRQWADRAGNTSPTQATGKHSLGQMLLDMSHIKETKCMHRQDKRNNQIANVLLGEKCRPSGNREIKSFGVEVSSRN